MTTQKTFLTTIFLAFSFVLIFFAFPISYTHAEEFGFTEAQKIAFCSALNSNNIYTNSNLRLIQTYLKNTYFPQIIVTGLDDVQNRKYISKYQYAFGLSPTGKINSLTAQLLGSKYNCYNIESKIINYQKNPPVRTVSQSEVLNYLLTTFLNFSSSTKTYLENTVQVFVATTTSTSENLPATSLESN